MSAGAVFKLIANDGKADRMLMSTQLLNQRIKDIINQRAGQGKSDITPTLLDIERTHILFINAHFKPYAALAYEYNKVRPQTGGINFGNSMQFSIPQFGDFFSDMVVNIGISQANGSTVEFPANEIKIPSTVNTGTPSNPVLSTVDVNPFTQFAFGPHSGPITIKNTSSPFSGRFFSGKGSDKANVGIKFDFVDPNGHIFPKHTGDSSRRGLPTVVVNNLIRYCEYPGNFIFSNVGFSVNGNPLDAYSRNAMIMFEKTQVPVSKRWSYNALNGQQNPKSGLGDLFTATVVDQEYTLPTSQIIGNKIGAWDKSQGPDVATFSMAKLVPLTSDITKPTLLNAIPATDLNNPPTAASGQATVGQKQISVLDGPQTPKMSQPPLSLWIPLYFWFNRSIEMAIPSVSIPFGQRFITISIAELNTSNYGNLLYQVPGAYVKKTTIYNSHNPTGILTSEDDIDTVEVEIAAWAGSDIIGESPSWPGLTFPTPITNIVDVPTTVTADLYINNIFVNPEIHDIYIKRIGFSLIRVYREQSNSIVGQSSSDILLSSLKWPIEYMLVGLQPYWNTNSVQNATAWRDWHRFSKNLTAFSNALLGGNTRTEGIPTIDSSDPSNIITSTYVGQNKVSSDQYYIPCQTTDSMSIVSHGITIFDNYPAIFYNSYLPYIYYNPSTWTCQEDNSLLFVNFCLFPGMYQPSGHLNISRARETYVNLTSTYVSTNGRANFIVVASAINFLLISDGSAVLRYST
jgi:hypothetical protein